MSRVLLLQVLVAVICMWTPASSAQSSDCQLPMDRGPCKGLFMRYYYNVKASQCEQFMYGGCYGNHNKFETTAACEKACVADQTTTSLSGNGGCSMAKDIGPCDAIIQRYYFDATTGRCQTFDWGGCMPNGNNFETLKDCQSVCMNSF